MIDHDPATSCHRAATFCRLHQDRSGFVMPNAWDAGSAIMLAQADFPAIATTSGGIAFSLGKADYMIPEGTDPVSRAQMFDRIREITAAVELPVNGDLEYGYGESPEIVAETIRLAVDAGLAGGNIEDHAHGALYDESLAVERIAAAREAVDASGSGFVLTARTDGLLHRPSAPLADSIRRANRYRQAGADCLYITGVNEPHAIAELVREIDAPLNAVMGLGDTTLTVATLRSAGVARISLGASIARAVMGLIRDSARELREHGTLTFAERQIPQAELNALFAKRHARYR
jgi:2-methylisocitrate lyase-like PEP mutase family enzyme